MAHQSITVDERDGAIRTDWTGHIFDGEYADRHTLHGGTSSTGDLPLVASSTRRGSDGDNTFGYTHTGRTNGTRYYYYVIAYRSGHSDSRSSRVSGVPGTVPSSAPTGLSGTALSSTSFSASWNSVSGDGDIFYRLGYFANGSWTYSTTTNTSITITGLTPGTTFLLSVQARNQYGPGPFSHSSNYPTVTLPAAASAPSTPSAPTVSAIDHDSLSASWSAVSGATSYNLRWRVSGSGGNWSGGVSSGTSRSINGLASSTTYEVQVQAVNSGGMSGWSSSGTGTTTAVPANAPATPSAPSVSRIDHDSLSVSWSSVTSAASYGVRYRVNGSGSSYSTTSTSGTSLTINGLAASTTYEVQIQARNSIGNSGWSSSGTGSTGAAPVVVVVPGSVTSLSVSNISHDFFTITWSAPSSGGSATGYHVQYKRSTDNSYTSASDTISPSNVAELDANADYDVRVRAYNSAGNGAWESTTATTANRPGFPLTAVAGDGQVTLRWNRHRLGTFSGGNHYYVSTYRVYRWLNGDDLSDSRFKNDGGAQISTEGLFEGHGEGSQQSFTYVDTTAVNGTQYWYQVGGNRGFQSGEVRVGTNVVGPRTPMAEVDPAPNTPGAPTVTGIDEDSIRVSWASVNNATSYNVRYRQSGVSDWLSAGSTTNLTTDIDGLLASTTYQVQIQAAGTGGSSAYSSSGTGTTDAAPANAPATPSAPSVSQIDHDSISVSWSSVTGAASYGVRYRVNGSGSSYSNTSTNNTSLTINGLAASTTYEVQIQARNSAGNSDWSSSGTGSTGPPLVVVPGSVTSLSVSNISHDFFTITWSAPSSGGSTTGYHVQYKRSTDSSYTNVSDTISPSSVTGLDFSTDYDIQVRAYNSGGNGPWESTTARTANRPGFPLTAVAGDGQVTLRWSRHRLGTFSGGNAYYVSTYRVYRWLNGDDLSESRFKNDGGAQISTEGLFEGHGEGSQQSFTYVDTTAVNGTQYWYQVGGNRGFQTGEVRVGTNVVGPRTPTGEVDSAPDTPGAPTVTGVDADSIRVSWVSVNNANSYNVRYRQSGVSDWSSAGSTTNLTTDIDGLLASTTYQVQIQAVGTGGSSAYSSSGTGATLGSGTVEEVPGAVTSLSISDIISTGVFCFVVCTHEWWNPCWLSCSVQT